MKIHRIDLSMLNLTSPLFIPKWKGTIKFSKFFIEFGVLGTKLIRDSLITEYAINSTHYAVIIGKSCYANKSKEDLRYYCQRVLEHDTGN